MIHEYTAYGPDRVISGLGAVERLGAELERLDARRALLITGRTLATQTPLVARVEELLGSRHAATFAGCAQHVPGTSVREARAQAEACRADALVVFGGGSPVDTAKMVVFRDLEVGRNALPQIAIPTTLSAGEFTHAAGETDDQTRVKHVFVRPEIQPRVVILDPAVTVETPRWLWASTGVKALDHCVEQLWWPRSHPVLGALALGALKALRTWLPASLDPSALEARLACQHAAWMSLFGLLNLQGIGLRLSHPIGHQIGARWDIPHGVTSCIVLPACFRFLADRTAPAQARIARAMGVASEGLGDRELADRAAEAVEAFIDSLGVPRRLSEAGAKREEIPAVARAIADELAQMGTPDTDLATPEALTQLLEELW